MTFKSTRNKPPTHIPQTKPPDHEEQNGLSWENGFKVRLGNGTVKNIADAAVQLVTIVMYTVSICFAACMVGFVVLIVALVYEPTLWGMVPWIDGQGSDPGN